MKKLIKTKHFWRMFIFLIISLSAYCLSYFYLFALHDILGSIVCVFFLFIFFHFLSLDMQKYNFKKVFFIFLSFTIIGISVLFMSGWDYNFLLILSIVFFNLSLLALFYSLMTIDFNSISYFLKGGYIFTLIITIFYSITLLGIFQKFPFTCDGLQEASSKMIRFIEKPFVLSVQKIDSLIDSANNDAEEISFKTGDINQKIEDILIDAKDVDVLVGTSSFFYPIIGQFNEWKTNTIDQVMSQQESYSSNVCDILLQEINEKYNIKEFRMSAVLLIYLLLFGFVRISIFIMSFIGFLVFKLLYITGLYKINKIKKEVKEIK